MAMYIPVGGSLYTPWSIIAWDRPVRRELPESGSYKTTETIIGANERIGFSLSGGDYITIIKIWTGDIGGHLWLSFLAKFDSVTASFRWRLIDNDTGVVYYSHSRTLGTSPIKFLLHFPQIPANSCLKFQAGHNYSGYITARIGKMEISWYHTLQYIKWELLRSKESVYIGDESGIDSDKTQDNPIPGDKIPLPAQRARPVASGGGGGDLLTPSSY